VRHGDPHAATAPSTGARVGYVRVSTIAQTLDQQNAALAAAGVTKTFSDTMSGARDDRVWRPPTSRFTQSGDPATEFEMSCRRSDVAPTPFPFTSAGYLVHRGQGTLAGVYERGEVNNEYFQWAVHNRDPHFQGADDHAQLYRDALTRFGFASDAPTAETLLARISERLPGPAGYTSD
jgi:hypothetical protein